MRILVITNMYPPHHLGGYELSCQDVMSRLRARGHEVTVLTTTTRLKGVSDPPDERANGVRRDLTFYWDDHRLVNPPLRRRLAIERANQRALRSALDEVQPDVVSVWAMGAMSLGLLTTLVEEGRSIVFAVCDDWLLYGPKLDAWTRLFRRHPVSARAVRRLTGVPTRVPDLSAAGAFCFVSEFTRRRAADLAQLHPDRSTVVYSGIDRRDFPPAAAEQRPWRGRLVSVGRIDDRKGLDVAVDALRLLPEDTVLEIIGRGDDAYRARLADQVSAAGLGDRVHFDAAPRAQLPNRYRAADVLVFPVTWEEPFGLVPIEAMACGVPVVATGTGGSGEFLVHERNCLLVPPHDVAALATAVSRLRDDPTLRARLIANGLRLAEELTTDRLAEEFEAWHVAAAERFAQGQPHDRPAPLTAMSALDPAAE